VSPTEPPRRVRSSWRITFRGKGFRRGSAEGVGFEPTGTLPRPSGFQAEFRRRPRCERYSESDAPRIAARRRLIPRISRAMIRWLSGSTPAALLRPGKARRCGLFVAKFQMEGHSSPFPPRSGAVLAYPIGSRRGGCCTSRPCRRCAGPSLLSGLAGRAEAGWRCPSRSIPGRSGGNSSPCGVVNVCQLHRHRCLSPWGTALMVG